MKLSKNLKVIISVFVAFIMALVVSAAVLPFATKIANADSGQVEFELTLVNYDGTAYEGVADFSTEHTDIICVQIKLIDGFTFEDEGETFNAIITTYSLKLSYNQDLLELQTSDPKITGTNVVAQGASMPTTSGVSNGVISVVGTYADGVEDSFVAFTAIFKVKSGATAGTANFGLSDVAVGNGSGFGPAKVPSTSVLSSTGISSIAIHEASDDASVKDNTITVKKVDENGDPTGDALAVTYDDTTKTFEITDPVEYLTTKLYIEAEANNDYATVNGLDEDSDKIKTVSWADSSTTETTVSGIFSITPENGDPAVSYNLKVTRNAASDDVSASFGLKAGTDYDQSVSLVSGTTSYAISTAVPNEDKDEVEFVFAPTVNAASMSVTYVKDGDSTPVTVSNGDKLALTSGDYTATVKVNSEKAIVNGTTYDDATQADVATYTVTFTVAKSSDVSASLKVEAGTAEVGVSEIYSKTDLDSTVTGTTVISSEIAYSNRSNVKFTFGANDTEAKSATLKYQKSGGSEETATSGTEVVLEDGEYTLTLSVTAEDDTTKDYTFTLTVTAPDTRVTLASVKLEKTGETTLVASYTAETHTYTFDTEIPLAKRNGWSLNIEKDFSGQTIDLPDDATSLVLNAGSNTKTITVHAEDTTVDTQDYSIVIKLSGGLKIKSTSSLYFATFDTDTNKLVPLADPKECKDVPDGKTVYITGFNKSHISVANGYGYVTRGNLFAEFENATVEIYNTDHDLLTAAADRITTNVSISLIEGGEEIQTVKVVIRGDINCDGNVNANDIAWLQLAIAGYKSDAEEYELAAADTDREDNDAGVSGEGVLNAYDITNIQMHMTRSACIYPD